MVVMQLVLNSRTHYGQGVSCNHDDGDVDGDGDCDGWGDDFFRLPP